MKSANRRNIFKPLQVDGPELNHHFGAISNRMRKVTGKRYVQLSGNTDTDPVAANLVGNDCEYTNVGRRRIPVVRLVDLNDNLYAWLAVLAQWDALATPSKRRQRRFLFVSLALSVYFGPQDDDNKLLMFRAEWTGARPAGDGTNTFRPPTAGHPHWHFDAVSSLVAKAREGRNGSVPIPEVQNAELFDTYETDSINDFLKPGIDRIHFASGATWWKSDSAHAHTPENPSELESWADGCATYMRDELRSLSRRGGRDS